MDWWFTSPFAQIMGNRISGKGSEARKMAKMYAEAEAQLEVQISNLKSDFETAETYKNEKYSKFMYGEGSAEGKILTDFENAVAIWNNKFENMMQYMKSHCVVLDSRKERARELKEYYEAIAEAEEREING